MRDPLTVAVAQPPCVGYDVATNALVHAATVRAAGSRVVVFPELSLTGYHFDAPAVAPADGRLAPLVEACAATGSVALVGAPVDGGHGRPHIAMIAVDRAGAAVAYRKVWLGNAEMPRFAPGTGPAVLAVDGWRIGLAICRDTGVPRHAADTVAEGADVYAAGVLETADDTEVMEQRAGRVATDHGIWVAVASFAGATGEGYSRAAGRSAIWAPGGRVVARAGTGPGAVVRAILADPPGTAGPHPGAG